MTQHCRKSHSDQHVFFTYVCLVNELSAKQSKHGNDRTSFAEEDAEVDGKDDETIRVEKSKALHELVENDKSNQHKLVSNNENSSKIVKYASIPNVGDDMTDNEDRGNPNLIKLTKMKWLTEKDDGSPDSSLASLSVSSIETTTSQDSYVSSDSITDGDRYLSTILKLDKEHNLFGLSSRMAAALKTPLKKIRPIKNDRPVFHQTQIVQVCCADSCCEHRSNTSFPCSLKCIRCSSCCFDTSMCNVCTKTCAVTPRIVFAPKTSKYHATCKNSSCTIVPRKKSFKLPRSHYNSYCNPPIRCGMENSSPYGLKVYLDRKVKYDVAPIEISPKSSSILQKPFSARPCNHNPRCTPPSACFPYLMPCFWPSRPSAPCSHPNKCFHNPPCPPPICPKVPAEYMCPHEEPCADKKQCMYNTCIAKNERVTDEASNFETAPKGKPGKSESVASRKKKNAQSREASKASQGSDQAGQRSQKSSTSSKGNKTEQQSQPQQPDQAEGYADTPTQVDKPGKKGKKGKSGNGNQPSSQGNQAANPAPGQVSQGPNQDESQNMSQGNKPTNQVPIQPGPYPGTGQGTPYPGTGQGTPYPGTGQVTPYPVTPYPAGQVTPYTGTGQGSQGVNQAANQGTQALSQPISQGGEAINQAANQGSQAVNQAANQGTQALSQVANQGNQNINQAANQISHGVNQVPNQGTQAINQGSQALNQAAGQMNQAANQAAAQGSQAVSRAESQASEATNKLNPQPPKP